MVSSPTLARSRAISSSRSSAGRLFSAAWPPARKSSRQPERVAAVTPSSRESEFQVFAAEEAEDGVGLALGGEAAALAGIRGVGHGCGLLGLDAMMSQRDVQRNPGAEERERPRLRPPAS